MNDITDEAKAKAKHSVKKKKMKRKENENENNSVRNGNKSLINEQIPFASDMDSDQGACSYSTKQSNSEKLVVKEKSLQEQFNIQTNNAAEFIEKLPEELIKINLDKTVNEIKEIDSKCDYDKCKAKTTLIGQNCEHCKKRFCFKHNLPEVHGCTDAVKRAERKVFLKPVPAKQKNEEKELAAAKKRLEAKLKNMKVSRMQKLGNTKKK